MLSALLLFAAFALLDVAVPKESSYRPYILLAWLFACVGLGVFLIVVGFKSLRSGISWRACLSVLCGAIVLPLSAFLLAVVLWPEAVVPLLVNP